MTDQPGDGTTTPKTLPSYGRVARPSNWDNLSDQQRYWWIANHSDPYKRIELALEALRKQK